MFSLSYLMALALLTTPPDGPEGAGLDGQAYLRPTLQTLAVQWEILDPREVRYILARPEDFVSDLTLLRRRFQDLANAPNLSDGLRFPDRATVNDFLAFNRAYRQHIDVRQPVELCHWWDLRAALHVESQDPQRVFELAYHFDAAGEAERALPFALAAAAQARAQNALAIAEQQYRIAARGLAAAPRFTHRLGGPVAQRRLQRAHDAGSRGAPAPSGDRLRGRVPPGAC